MKIDIICRGKVSWLAQEMLEGHELEFFDDTMDEYKNTNESVNENVFISIGEPNARKRLYEFYKDRNHISIISKKSYISPKAKVAPGSIVMHNANIEINASLGLCCFVNTNTTIDVGTKVGDFTRFGSNVHAAEYVTIGNNCIVGSNVVIVPRVTIGNNCIICAGSIVTKSFGDNKVIGGMPARSIKTNE